MWLSFSRTHLRRENVFRNDKFHFLTTLFVMLFFYIYNISTEYDEDDDVDEVDDDDVDGDDYIAIC